MRLSRPILALAFALAAGTARADDTKEFLDPNNWDGIKEYWTLEGNKVTGSTKVDPKFNTFFASKKKYGDFEMTFKVKLVDGKGNSGLQVRSKIVDEKKFVVAGPQVDVGKGYFGSLYGEKFGGYLLKAKKDVAKLDGFNDYHVLVKGNHITIKVNGETTIDEDFPDDKGKNPAPAEGIIAFQLHAGGPMTVEFTDIVFKDLSKK